LDENFFPADHVSHVATPMTLEVSGAATLTRSHFVFLRSKLRRKSSRSESFASDKVLT